MIDLEGGWMFLFITMRREYVFTYIGLGSGSLQLPYKLTGDQVG